MKKRGATILEVVSSLLVGVLVVGTMVAFVRTGDSVWNTGHAEQRTKDVLYQAVNKMSPFVRNGLRIDATSSSTMAVVVWPKVDTVNGGFLIPLVDGDTYRFYLSDPTGNPATSGTILWMSKNGLPDPGWSMRSATAGAVDLGDTSLSFAYTPAGSPSMVQLTASSTKLAGTNPVVQDTATENLVLRNYQAANP